jgi:SAM-dependent methyltransferase
MAASHPVFEHRNPNLPGFWDERFAQQFTPWDQASVPGELQRFVAQAAAPMSTLIPGCGVGHEVRHLAEAGWPVVAIDFSPVAVAVAQSELGTYSDRVVQADFFAFVSPTPIHFIYERAFLCALPRSQWPDVVARWAKLLPVDGLLGGFFFFDAKVGGPPFGADQLQLAVLLQPYFTLLEDRPAEQSIPLFAGREHWQLWRRREETALDACVGE